MTNNRLPTLCDLDDWELVNSDQDVRGYPLRTRTGGTVGIIRRMLVDRDDERVAALVLDNGLAVPVEEVELRDGAVLIDEVRDMPPGLVVPPAREDAETDETVIPIVEEKLVVGKRAVERGRVRVRSRIVETPVHEQVQLREEHVDVERRPVNEPVRDAGQLFKDRTVEVTATSEEAVVGKDARVVEEVVVSKDTRERVERIDDSVRTTEVDVQEDSGKVR